MASFRRSCLSDIDPLGSGFDQPLMPVEIQRADPTARRRAAVLITVATVVAGALVFAMIRYLDDAGAAPSDEPGELRNQLEMMIAGLAALALPILVACVYLWRFARRVVDTRRFPPPGTAVTRDTPVIAGPAAHLRGRFLEGLAVVTAVAAVGAPVVLWLLLGALTATA